MNLYFWLWHKAIRDGYAGLIGFWWHIWSAWAFWLSARKHYRRGNIWRARLQIKGITKHIEWAWYSVSYM